MVYDEAITRKSFNEMLRFLRFANKIGEVPLLFGGWAVYQYNPYAGSRGVDFVVSDENFDACVDFLVSIGYELKELRLKKGTIFFDLYKKSERINPEIELDLDFFYKKAERVYLKGTEHEVLLPKLPTLFLSKAQALISRDVPKDQSDVISLLAKFRDTDFEIKRNLDEKTKSKLELLINKIDVFSLVMKPTKKNIEEVNSRLKKLLK